MTGGKVTFSSSESFKRAPMVTGGGGGDSGREGAGRRLGKVEEVLGTMLAQGIEVWWSQEEDRRKEGDDGASGRAPLVTGRSEEEEEE